jgi:hypothetical protein
MEHAGVVVFHAIDRKEQPQHGYGPGQGIQDFGFMRHDPFDKNTKRYQNNKISKLKIGFRQPLNLNQCNCS